MAAVIQFLLVENVRIVVRSLKYRNNMSCTSNENVEFFYEDRYKE